MPLVGEGCPTARVKDVIRRRQVDFFVKGASVIKFSALRFMIGNFLLLLYLV